MQTKKNEIYNADDVIGGKNSWVGGQDSVFCQNLFLLVCFQTNRVNLKCPNSSRKIH